MVFQYNDSLKKIIKILLQQQLSNPKMYVQAYLLLQKQKLGNELNIKSKISSQSTKQTY